MNDKPYTPETAGEILSCSAGHIRKLCRAGKLRHFRLGNRYRIPASALEELECQTTVSEGSKTIGSSLGEKTANDQGIAYLRAMKAKK